MPNKLLHSLPSLPRIGFSFALCPTLYHMSYLGRGPFENYPDRKSAAHLGQWTTTPLEMHEEYIVPSENGNRTDCQWVAFLDNKGSGMVIASNDEQSTFCFSASLWNQKELHKAKHSIDLEERSNGKNNIYVNIDHALMGVGGDVGWSPCVYEQFRVQANKCYDFSILIIP